MAKRLQIYTAFNEILIQASDSDMNLRAMLQAPINNKKAKFSIIKTEHLSMTFEFGTKPSFTAISSPD